MKIVLLMIFIVPSITGSAITSTDINSIRDTIPNSVHYVPTRQITHGPKKHWFGYYDKLQMDPSGRYVLSMQVDFENRSPRAEDEIAIGIIDLQDNDRWTQLGTSKAWSWQQGCMLQFIPGSKNEIIWNDREEGKFVSHILNIETQEKRTLPFAIYTLSPDGRTAMGVDFDRINDLRRGYGYAGVPDPNADEIAPMNAGIYRCDLIDAKKELVISLADMMQAELPDSDDPAFTEDYFLKHHWFNHLLFNTDGSRFIFLHRWKSSGKGDVGGFGTLMYTANPDGSDVRLVDPSGFTSHFIWRDPTHILAWSYHASNGHAFYLYEDRAYAEPEGVGIKTMKKNGHCTYLPGNRYILNDTYPDKETRLQTVYLYDIIKNKKIDLGKFYLAPEYKGEWRTDTHPRFSPDGHKIIIDCPVADSGRQLVLMDIKELAQLN
ncbi:MAG: hypothetical protein OEQ53_18710 [Saprospiraceae bacterium]|nr:hypothetical protein [Saprospiraceae bacterium]